MSEKDAILGCWEAEREKPLEKGETYLERAEKLLYRRLYEYIISENWTGVGQVALYLGRLKLI